MNNYVEVNSLTNRASLIFKDTCIKFNELLKKYYNKNLNKKLIIYWDTYGNNNLKLFSTKNIIQNIDRKHHNYLCNKKTCSNYIKKLKLYEYYPKTYNNLSEISNISIDNLYFIKDIYSTAGRGVKCITGKELLNYKINKTEIIQEGIQNLKLIENKKFVIRAYIIIFNNKIYLSKHSLCIVHSKEYDKLSKSYDIQIKHIVGDGIIPLSETIFYSCINNIKEALINMKELFKPVIKNSKNKYIIIGPDILITDNGEIKFLEFNTFPNISWVTNKERLVKEKMLLDLFKLVFLNYKSDTLLPITPDLQ
jgi:hypothetical protein